MKFNKKYIFSFILIFIFIFLYNYFLTSVYGDEIWNYGFAYNISTGLVPYKDFNLVITPLYPMLASIFINIFGHHLWSVHIFNCIILSFMILLFYFKLGKKSFLLVPFVLLNGYLGYNIFSVFLIILLLFVVDSNVKNREIIIALLVSLSFLNKQTIGICLFIPMLYYSKDKVNSLVVFLLPIFVFVIYLLTNGAFNEFIDYCFWGLLNFGNSNGIYFYLPLEVIICIILVFFLIKSKFKNELLFYILMFQVITVPIVDDYHFMLGLIPVIYYRLLVKEVDFFKLKYYFIIVIFFCFVWNFCVRGCELKYLYNDKSSFLHGRNIPKYIEDSITEISNYINIVRDDYDYIYFFSANSYYVKLNSNYPISKYDLINNGNMGYNGSVKYIEEVNNFCQTNSCMFILYKHEFTNNLSQTNKELVNYVVDNYSKFTVIDTFDIYVDK